MKRKYLAYAGIVSAAILVIMFLTIPLIPLFAAGHTGLFLLALPLNSLAYGLLVWLCLRLAEKLRRPAS